MAAGDQIQDTDYNSLQDRAQLLLGTGTGSRGYGQTVQTADVFTGNIITRDQWNSLRDDILSIRVHQDGVSPVAATVAKGAPINYSLLSNYDSLLNTADANRFNIASGQALVTTKATQSVTATWTTQAQAVLTVTFANANEGRYFFNSGGKVRISGSRSGGSSTSQNNAWTNFLANIGNIAFGAATSEFINYYDLTNAYQTYYQTSLSTPYSSNYFQLSARCDVANNSSGTATQIEIRITLRDDHVPIGAGPDSTDGTVTFVVDELKATGNLYPTGTWNITSPTYSLGAISTT